jgi:hypothetical protein
MLRLNFGQHKQNIYTSQVHKLLVQLGLKYTLMPGTGTATGPASQLLLTAVAALSPPAVAVSCHGYITNHMVHLALY